MSYENWHKTGPTKPYPEPTTEEPDDEQLERWVLDSIVDATDGCTVEPDGYCEHFHVSWLLYLDLI